MPRLNPGVLTTWVTLDDDMQDGTTPTYEPRRVKVGLQGTSAIEGSTGTWAVTLRYHPQITLNTRITLDDGTEMYVRGVGNQQNADRSNWMTLQCEEAETP